MFNVNNKKLTSSKVFKTLTCGIKLRGEDILLLRRGSVDLKKAYISIKDDRIYLNNYLNTSKFGNNRSMLLIKKSEFFFINKLLKGSSFILVPNILTREASFFKLKVSVCKKLKSIKKIKKNPTVLNKELFYEQR